MLKRMTKTAAKKRQHSARRGALQGLGIGGLLGAGTGAALTHTARSMLQRVDPELVEEIMGPARKHFLHGALLKSVPGALWGAGIGAGIGHFRRWRQEHQRVQATQSEKRANLFERQLAKQAQEAGHDWVINRYEVPNYPDGFDDDNENDMDTADAMAVFRKRHPHRAGKYDKQLIALEPPLKRRVEQNEAMLLSSMKAGGITGALGGAAIGALTGKGWRRLGRGVGGAAAGGLGGLLFGMVPATVIAGHHEAKDHDYRSAKRESRVVIDALKREMRGQGLHVNDPDKKARKVKVEQRVHHYHHEDPFADLYRHR